MRAKANSLLPIAALIGLIAWVYAPAVHGGWIWDDRLAISDNLLLRQPGALARIWFAPAGPDYFPLKTTVEWVEWRLFGPQVEGYHLVSIGLHLLSALLFWRLLDRLGLRCGWIGALIFALHPVAVESVAWISELKNTLSLPLLLLAMLFYLRGHISTRDNGGRCRVLRYDPLPLLFFTLALLCKTSVVMFPAVLLLFAWWRRGRISRADLRESLPYFALSLVLGAATLWFQVYRPNYGEPLVLHGAASRLAGAGVAAASYLAKAVLPAALAFLYPARPLAASGSAPFLPWAALVAAGAWIWTKRDSWGRPALAGLGFFFINLAPVLGLLPMAFLRFSPTADHFAYISLLGLAGLAGAALEAAPAAPRWTMVCLLGALLAGASHRQVQFYGSEQRLWTEVLRLNPGAWVARNGLGLIRAGTGDFAGAQADFEQAIAAKPDYAEAHDNLGMVLDARGELAEAIANYEAAVRLQPGYAPAHNNLANAFLRSGRPEEAVAQYREALRLKPDYVGAHANLSAALAQLGRRDEALDEMRQAVRLSPDDPELRKRLDALSGR